MVTRTQETDNLVLLHVACALPLCSPQFDTGEALPIQAPLPICGLLGGFSALSSLFAFHSGVSCEYLREDHGSLVDRQTEPRRVNVGFDFHFPRSWKSSGFLPKAPDIVVGSPCSTYPHWTA